MTLFLSKTAKRQLTPPVPYQHGLVATAIFKMPMTDDYTAANDLIEIGTVPADATIVGASVFGLNFTAGTTALVATIDGEAGDADEARDLTDEVLFAAAPATAVGQEATRAQCLAIAPSKTHRGLGLRLSEDEAADPAKVLTVVIEYTL